MKLHGNSFNDNGVLSTILEREIPIAELWSIHSVSTLANKTLDWIVFFLKEAWIDPCSHFLALLLIWLCDKATAHSILTLYRSKLTADKVSPTTKKSLESIAIDVANRRTSKPLLPRWRTMHGEGSTRGIQGFHQMFRGSYQLAHAGKCRHQFQVMLPLIC